MNPTTNTEALREEFNKTFIHNHIPTDIKCRLEEARDWFIKQYHSTNNKDEIAELKRRVIYWNELHSEVINENQQLQSRIDELQKGNEIQTQLNEKLLSYSENQRKVIVLLIEGIKEIKGCLPYSTSLKIDNLIDTSNSFTKPLPNKPKTN